MLSLKQHKGLKKMGGKSFVSQQQEPEYLHSNYKEVYEVLLWSK